MHALAWQCDHKADSSLRLGLNKVSNVPDIDLSERRREADTLASYPRDTSQHRVCACVCAHRLSVRHQRHTLSSPVCFGKGIELEGKGPQHGAIYSQQLPMLGVRAQAWIQWRTARGSGGDVVLVDQQASYAGYTGCSCYRWWQR